MAGLWCPPAFHTPPLLPAEDQECQPHELHSAHHHTLQVSGEISDQRCHGTMVALLTRPHHPPLSFTVRLNRYYLSTLSLLLGLMSTPNYYLLPPEAREYT